jgi:hypothetical protein
MRVLRIALGVVWAAAAIACISFWLFLAVGTAVMFLESYGNPPDTYTGQDADRGGAWVALAALALLTVIAAAIILPFFRLRRRRQLTQAPPT